MDRNTERSIDRDIEFIDDMIDCLDDGDLDAVYDYLDDWKDELEALKRIPQ